MRGAVEFQETKRRVAVQILKLLGNSKDIIIFKRKYHGVRVLVKHSSDVPKGLLNFKKNTIHSINDLPGGRSSLVRIGERKGEKLQVNFQTESHDEAGQLLKEKNREYKDATCELKGMQVVCVFSPSESLLLYTSGVSHVLGKVPFVQDFTKAFETTGDMDTKLTWTPYNGQQGFFGSFERELNALVEIAFQVNAAATKAMGEAGNIELAAADMAARIREVLSQCTLSAPFYQIEVNGRSYETSGINWITALGDDREKFRSIFVEEDNEILEQITPDFLSQNARYKAKHAPLETVWPDQLGPEAFQTFVEVYARCLTQEFRTNNHILLKSTIKKSDFQTAVLNSFLEEGIPKLEAPHDTHGEEFYNKLGDQWEAQAVEMEKTLEQRLEKRAETAGRELLSKQTVPKAPSQTTRRKSKTSSRNANQPVQAVGTSVAPNLTDGFPTASKQLPEEKTKPRSKPSEDLQVVGQSVSRPDLELLARQQAALSGLERMEVSTLMETRRTKADRLLRQFQADVVMPDKYRADKRITRATFVPYGSFFYSENAGDLDAYCVLSVGTGTFKRACEQQNKTYSSNLKRALQIKDNQQDVTLQVGDVEVDIHHVPDGQMVSALKIQPVIWLHNYIVGEIIDNPSISIYYDGLKKWCKEKGIYSSKYGLIRGITLALLAVDTAARTSTDEPFADYSITVQRFLRHEDDEDWKMQPYKVLKAKIFWQTTPSADGSPREDQGGNRRRYEVVSMTEKRRVGMLVYLTEETETLQTTIPYDDFPTVRTLLQKIEKNGNTKYLLPLRSTDGMLALLVNEAAQVVVMSHVQPETSITTVPTL